VPGYYVQNFGCRATQADGAALERQFEECGLERAGTAEQAAVVVLNTCTVTAAADQDARAAVRRVQRRNPAAQIVVTGCYAQRAPEEVAALPGVACVVGNSHKHELARIVTASRSGWPQTPAADAMTGETGPIAALKALRHPNPVQSACGSFSGAQALVPLMTLSASSECRVSDAGGPIFVSDIFAHTELIAAPVFDAPNERTRPNLKIQDGCDNRCSFCVIPYVRGHSRSLESERIIAEVNTLVAAGYREVVISGINLGRWGRDLGVSSTASLSKSGQPPATNSRRLAMLIHDILSDTALEKLRISSVEPMDWSDELIALVAQSPRIAKHAHVPMQSGSDAVLRRMHRRYRPWHYREKIGKIRAAMPAAAIGADVMVGFPGETEAEFEATRRMIEELPFTYLHVFTYSARPGTPAAVMQNQVPGRVAQERNRILRDLAAEKKLAFMRGFVGKEVEAITLRSGDGGALEGDGPAGESARATPTEALTDNYLKLRLSGRHEPNRWLRARIEEVVNGMLVGSVEAARP